MFLVRKNGVALRMNRHSRGPTLYYHLRSARNSIAQYSRDKTGLEIVELVKEEVTYSNGITSGWYGVVIYPLTTPRKPKFKPVVVELRNGKLRAFNRACDFSNWKKRNSTTEYVVRELAE